MSSKDHAAKVSPAALQELQAIVYASNTTAESIRLGNIPLPDQNFSSTETTIEPMVGTQLGIDQSHRWSIGLRGDVSGFDIGSERNFTWNLLVSAQYQLSRNTSLRGAYRINDYKFEDGKGLGESKLCVR